MKVEARILDVESTITGDKIGMTIDQSALSHIMSVLTDLYSDPEAAIIREYSTNALDSHIVAGQTRPIEVDLPTPLSPFLTIRDFGLGLNGQDIHDVYSRYGTSTKRDSDDVVGMLGLGCKSALTYTDQFTLTGVKDGYMTQVSIGRDEDGGGSMTVVSEGPTTEPSGVTIVIPAKRGNDLEAKAHRFFSFWDEGTVLINGTPPKRVDGHWITPHLLVAPSGRNEALDLSLGENVVVMGNVAYPIPDEFFPPQDGVTSRYGGGNDWFGTSVSYKGANSHLVAFVPIGAVNFTPSREALQMTKRTKETLTSVINEARDKFKAAMFEKVKAAKTAGEAQNLARETARLGIKEKPIWQGREVLLALVRQARPQFRYDQDDTLFLVCPTSNGYGRRKTGEWHPSVTLEKDSILWVENFDGATMTPTKRAKLEAWVTQNQSKVGKTDAGTTRVFTQYVAVRSFTPDEKFWLKGHTIVDFEKDVAPIKLPKTHTPGTNRLRGSYVTWTSGTWDNSTPADKIDQSKPIVWYGGNRHALSQTMEWRYDFPPKDGTVVCLPANRIEKFKRDFPNAVELHQFARDTVAKYLANVSKEDAKAAHFQRQGDTRLQSLDAARVNDPALKAQILMAQKPVEAIVAQFKKWQRWIDEPADTPIVLDTDYPLLGSWSSLRKGEVLDHAIMYVNAVYAAKEAS